MIIIDVLGNPFALVLPRMGASLLRIGSTFELHGFLTVFFLMTFSGHTAHLREVPYQVPITSCLEEVTPL